MLVAFSVAPSVSDAAGGVTDAVAEAVRIVRQSGLPNRTDAMFTTIEGDWDECMALVKACVEAVAAHGPRVSLVLKADVRPGREGELTAKLERLETALERGAEANGPASEPGQAGQHQAGQHQAGATPEQPGFARPEAQI